MTDNIKPPSATKFFVAATIMVLLYTALGRVNDYTGQSGEPVVSDASALANIKVTTLSARDFSKRFHANGKPTLLFIYATWCPYCRQQFPVVTDIIKRYGSKINVVALSIDQEADTLSSFLAKKPQPLPFTPYIAPKTGSTAYMVMLQEAGGHFSGSIPYTALFKADGTLTTQLPGLTMKEEFEAAVKSAL